MQRQPNINKARDILGWESKVMRDEGLKLTYEWFQSLSKAKILIKERRDFSKYELRR